MSLKLNVSVANVEFANDGLFLTLGKIIPPFRDTGFVVDEFPCGTEKLWVDVTVTTVLDVDVLVGGIG